MKSSTDTQRKNLPNKWHIFTACNSLTDSYMRHSKKKTCLIYFNRSCLKKEEKGPHATFAIKHSKMSDIQQISSYTAVLAERDLYSTADTDLLKKMFFLEKLLTTQHDRLTPSINSLDVGSIDHDTRNGKKLREKNSHALQPPKQFHPIIINPGNR